MAPKELKVLGLLIEYRNGLYGSELVFHSEGSITRGSVYTLLERLVEKGYVTEEEVPPTPDLRLTRWRHKITAQGENAYNAFLREHKLQRVPAFVGT